MSSFRILLFISIASLTFASCTGDSAQKKQPAAAAAITKPALKPAGQLVANTLPSVPQDLMQSMFNSCTNVDFLFYNHSFSMNQTDTPSIQNTLTYISTTVPKELDTGCQPVGRIFFVSNGEGMTEAEFFLGNVCNYFIFYQNGKKIAANVMTAKGEEFLKGTINRVTNSMPK